MENLNEKFQTLVTQRLKQIERRRSEIRFITYFLIIIFFLTTLHLLISFKFINEAVSLVIDSYWSKVFFGFLVAFFLLYLAERERDQRLLNSQLVEDLKKKNKALDALYFISSLANSVLSRSKFLDLVSMLVVANLKAEMCSIMLLNQLTRSLEVESLCGGETQLLPTLDLKGNPFHSQPPKKINSPFMVAFKKKEIVAVEDFKKDNRFKLPEEGDSDCFYAMLSVPILVSGKAQGVINLYFYQPRHFAQEEVQFAQALATEVGAFLKEEKFVNEIKREQKDKEKLAKRILTIQEEERKRIAVAIHDDLLQSVVATLYRLEAWANSHQDFAKIPLEELKSLKEILKESVTNTRRLIHDLRPPTLEALGLVTAIKKLAHDFQKESGIKLDLEVGEIPSFSPHIELALFRLAQEALTNVLKHSKAQNVLIYLGLKGKKLLLKVKDDGIGFSPRRLSQEKDFLGAGIGLQVMKERVEMWDGKLRIKSSHRQGTEIKAFIPLKMASPSDEQVTLEKGNKSLPLPIF